MLSMCFVSVCSSRPLAKIKVLGVLPAHLPLVFGAGTVLESVPLLSFFLLCVLSLYREEVGGVRQYTR